MVWRTVSRPIVATISRLIASSVAKQIVHRARPCGDGPQSIAFEQAGNRMHAQKALLLWVMG